MSNRHHRERVVRDMQERFGYSSPGYVLRVIRQYDENPNNLVVGIRNKVALFRELELHKVYESHLDTISAIEDQIDKLEKLRESGEEWWSSGMRVGIVSDKETEITERQSIDDRLLYLHKERSRAYADHHRLLGDISPAERHVDVMATFKFDPDKGLQKMLSRNDAQLLPEGAVEVVSE